MDDRYSGENFPKMFDAAKFGELVASNALIEVPIHSLLGLITLKY